LLVSEGEASSPENEEEDPGRGRILRSRPRAGSSKALDLTPKASESMDISGNLSQTKSKTPSKNSAPDAPGHLQFFKTTLSKNETSIGFSR